MASDLERMGQKDSALFYFEKALDLADRSVGRKSRIVSTNAIAVGRLLLERGDNDRALDLFQESLAIRMELLGAVNYQVANAHDYIGNAHFAQERLDSALAHYTEGFRIRTLVRPPGHQDLAKSWWRIGAVQYEVGHVEEAQAALDSSFRIHPNAEAGWYLHKIAFDRQEFDKALEWLLPCARERVDDPATPTKQRNDTLVALKALAERLDRQDILKQFNLEEPAMRITFMLCFVIVALRSYGQEIALNGSIVIHNSRYTTGTHQFVQGASIRAPYAQATVSDADGSFVLEFVGAESGGPVRLSVMKPGWEVVNIREIEQVVLGRTDPLTVIMADRMALASAQAMFHRIAVDNIEHGYSRKMTVLRDGSRALAVRLAELSNDTNDSLVTIADAMDLLTGQRDDALQHAQELAEGFARMDLDRASDRFREAYGLFAKGDVDGTIALLGSESLDHEYAKARERSGEGVAIISRSNAAIRQLLQSYGLRADVEGSQLRFAASMATRERLLAIMAEQRDAIGPLEEVDALRTLAEMELNMALYDRSIAHLTQALSLVSSKVSGTHPVIAEIHAELGNALVAQSKFKEAMAEEELALQLQLSDPAVDSVDLATTYNNRANVHFEMNHITDAVADLRIAKGIWVRHLDPLDILVAKAHGNLANFLLAQGDLDGAENEALNSLRIRRAKLKADDPSIAHALQTLAGIASERSRYPEAVALNEEAGAILVKTFGEDHPDIARIHVMIALIHRDAQENQAGLVHLDTAISIAHRALGQDNSLTSVAYNHKANLLYRMDDLVGARQCVDSATAIEARIAKDPQYVSAMNLNLMAMIHSDRGLVDSALWCYERALPLEIATLGPMHPDVGILENNIGLTYFNHGSFPEALEHYQAAMTIFDRSLEGRNVQKANTWYNMATAHSFMGHFDSCMVCSDSTIAQYSVLFGADHPVLASALMYRTNCSSMAKRDLDNAWELAQRNIAIASKANGPKGTHMAIPLYSAGRVREARGELAAALELEEQAMAQLASAGPPSPAMGSRVQLTIGRILYQMGDTLKALAALDTADAFKPDPTSDWLRYRIALDRGEMTTALDYLITCARGRFTNPMTSVPFRVETITALRELTREIGREEVLDEFQLR